MNVLLYGATGYTGRLISRALAARGVRHIVAGRSRASIERWAATAGMPSRAFGVDAATLDGVSVVLNCAGPFSTTASPLARAAIAAGAHYLDLAGEVAEHERVRSLASDAEARGVMLMPGVGFGVVPTDCAAALAVRTLPNTRRLVIAYATVGGASRGTLETVSRGLAVPGFVRRDGALTPSWPAERTLELDLGEGPVRLATNPFRADLTSAFYSTGIGTIETYATSPARLRALMRSPLRRWGIVQKALSWLVARAPEGPSDAARARGRTRILVVAEGPGGTVEVRVRGPEAYEFTARAAVEIVARIGQAKPGYQTPSRVFGPGLLAPLLQTSTEGVDVRERPAGRTTWTVPAARAEHLEHTKEIP